MRCPNCSRDVAEGITICPSCDHILDPSFLGDVPEGLNDEDPDDAATQAPPPTRGRPTVAQRPASRPPARPPPPGSRPLPEDDATSAAGGPMAGPPPEDEATNLAPPRAARAASGRRPASRFAEPDAEPEVDAGPTNRELPAPALDEPRPARNSLGKLRAAPRAEEASTQQQPSVDERLARLDSRDDLPAPPGKAGRNSLGKVRAAPRAEEASTQQQESVDQRLAKVNKPNLKVAPPQQKAGNKYAPAAVARESESTRAQNVDNLPPAAPPPPMDPEAVFRNLWHALLDLSLEDKIEVGAASAAALMLFMPWRTVRGDDDIGLMTWGGFWSLVFVGGAMGLFYLRHSHRLPTLTPKLLTTGEMVLAGLSLPLNLLFIFTSINRTKVRGISGDTWLSMPGFGAVLGLLCGAGVVLGAALCWNRHRGDAN